MVKSTNSQPGVWQGFTYHEDAYLRKDDCTKPLQKMLTYTWAYMSYEIKQWPAAAELAAHFNDTMLASINTAALY